MQDELIKEMKALSDKLKAIEEKNPAAWKARRKVDAAQDILVRDWPKEEAKLAEAPKNGKKAATQ